MKLYVFLFVFQIVTGNEELCLLCKCSTANIVVRQNFFGGFRADEIEDWSPFTVIPDPNGKYLNVNCSGSKIPPKWPPIGLAGISGYFERNGMDKLADFPDSIKKKIIKLSITRNGPLEINEGDFEEFQQLEMLDLRRNRIRHLRERCFANLRRLSHLDLSENEIGEVEKWTSESNLIYLNLANNLISVIRPESLQGLRNLILLDLSNNLLSRLPDNFSSLLSKLKFLHLMGNQFEAIPRLPRSLQSVNISSNVLSSSVLPQIDDLIVLDVSSNNLDDLDNIYEQLALKVLKASHNYLSETGEWKSSELNVLDLGYNNFKKIPSEINSENLPHLRELYLDGNPLNEITFNRGKKAFVDLEILGLSSLGNISALNRDCFNGIILESYVNCSEESGIFVNLSNNKLRLIDEDSFRGFPICSVDLSRNRLTKIPQDLFRWEDLITADLQHNPWNCICELQWMLDKYLPHFYGVEPKILFDLRCAAPSRFKDRMFVYWYNSTTDVFCNGPSYFQYEYSNGKFLEIWTVSMIICTILSIIIIILIVSIVILLIFKSRRMKRLQNKSRKRSKPIFGELRINTDHKYNEISQDGSV